MPPRHCERSEAIHSRQAKKEWIASRSLSSGARSRDPLARNDVDRPIRMPINADAHFLFEIRTGKQASSSRTSEHSER
jgi:hypothetical protein